MFTEQNSSPAYGLGGACANVLAPPYQGEIRNMQAAQAQREYDNCKSAEPRRLGVAERIDRTIAEGHRTVERLQAAMEARDIIQKNPDFARLLDLLERF